MTKDPELSEQMDRIEEIINQLNADEVQLDEGQELYEEGQQLLAEIKDLLHEGEGNVVEID